MLGMGPVFDGMGLINAIYSYVDTIAIAFTSDRNMLPDPSAYADCLRDSFAELKAATSAAPAPTAKVAKPAKPPVKPAKPVPKSAPKPVLKAAAKPAKAKAIVKPPVVKAAARKPKKGTK